MNINKVFNLAEYFQVVDEIVNGFFDAETGEYQPHCGRVVGLTVFYNHCVVPKNNPLFKTIDDASDLNEVLKNEEIVKLYEFATQLGSDEFLSFEHAYKDAMQIVEYRKNDAHMLSHAIVDGVKALLDSFKASINVDELNDMMGVINRIASEEITPEALVKAYEDSDRFQVITGKKEKEE